MPAAPPLRAPARPAHDRVDELASGPRRRLPRANPPAPRRRDVRPMDIAPRFTFPDDDQPRPADRRSAVRRFGNKLSRWLARHAGPDGLTTRHHSNGEITLEVELATGPGLARPLKVRVIVTDYEAE